MTDNRPTEWQWKKPENGKIDGLTRAAWQDRGVEAWATTYWADSEHRVDVAIGGKRHCFADPAHGAKYAPADGQSFTPVAWPDTMAWQWRKLNADMDERTWRAVPRWRCGFGGETPHPAPLGATYGGSGSVMAERGEWWAPADQAGNPCAWPDLEPQPVVVIPAAEMTALVFYGHQARVGTWRCSGNGYNFEIAGGAFSEVCDGELWTPCDEHGNFCELRRVVSVEEMGEACRVREQQWRRAEAAERERDEWKRRAMAVRDEMLRMRSDISDVIAKAWEGGEQ